MDYFLQIYGTLPRAGPGSNELTRRAFQMIPHVPESPRILDIGCGPGMQTVELLKITNGKLLLWSNIYHSADFLKIARRYRDI